MAVVATFARLVFNNNDNLTAAAPNSNGAPRLLLRPTAAGILLGQLLRSLLRATITTSVLP
jgi:hypothetical protein